MNPHTNCRACLVYEDSFADYDFGQSHPMDPIRVSLTVSLARQLEALPELVRAPSASVEQLLTIHDPEFVDAVIRMSANPGKLDLRHGLGTEDNPTFPAMHDASRHVVGASLEGARLVWEGAVEHAANIAGGLHHAMPDRASGFCVYNDIAVAIQWLLDQGAQRVAYVDVDVHHGDGVEHIFYNDPRVLTISLHETGQMLFPGTGFPKQNGGPDAPGSAVNVALPPGTGDAGWLRAFHAVVPELLQSFQPEILITQHGCDSHREDPLADLTLTIDGQRASYLALHELAHQVAGGKWLALGGGGYAIADVVPRAWTHLLSIVRGQPLDSGIATPAQWQAEVAEMFAGRVPPSRMGDGREPRYRDWSEGYDPDTWLDRAIQQTRQTLFPLNGLDIWELP
ncbi:MAG TPA: acetoin utilization protein AcuC [Marmoricola sp.]|nr:acetoin utilization protein AcuC [Marmoricola sp.]